MDTENYSETLQLEIEDILSSFPLPIKSKTIVFILKHGDDASTIELYDNVQALLLKRSPEILSVMKEVENKEAIFIRQIVSTYNNLKGKEYIIVFIDKPNDSKLSISTWL